MADPVLGASLAVGGNLLGALNGAAAARKKNAILGEGMRQQDRAGMEASNITADFINQLRRSAPNPAVERGAFTTALGSPTISGPGGARFRADAANVGGTTQRYGGQLADLFARIRAPQLQHQSEAEMLMGLSNALRPVQLRAQNDAFLTNLRAGMKQPNPWLGLLGQGLSQAGSYMVANG